MSDTLVPVLSFKDFQSDQEVRWCPGCDDYVILRAMQKALPQMGRNKEDFVFVSGIGCSSRFPYYVDTYGLHGIHGRATAIATGVKLGNPDLSVWVITGDGDAMAIGGNHFIHLIRRNLNIKVVIFNNEIYGLTKGQFSPTSRMEQRTKTSPYGNIQPPFRPGKLTIGSEGRYFARVPGNDPKYLEEIFIEAEKFKGTAVIEVLQNCVIFNDGAFNDVTDRATAADTQLRLEHGKPMIFGKDRNKGIRANGMKLEVVTIGEDGITEADILVHDAHDPNPNLHSCLSTMEMPIAMGEIRKIEEPPYDEIYFERMKRVADRTDIRTLDELFFSGDTYRVD
jgi:2-oxoglutarate ferredoxin oxidoreductase subunit beta